MLELMAAPLAACVVLVGIHVYLGMHVIQRKVIFVDLALAQIAALGATVGFLLGLNAHGGGAFVFSLCFSIGGAGIFSLTRMRHERVPQEAIIGIVYAVALAFAILVADRAPEGAEHIKDTLVGSILWVTWPTIGKTALIYLLIGALHVVFRERFLQISFHPERAYQEKRWVRLWDFLFYVTFAFVITSAVAIAGVLLVFSYLVIPAVVATLFAKRVAARLAIGWGVGMVGCVAGLLGSYALDLPSGPAVVAALGLTLVLSGLVYFVRAAESRSSAALKVLGGVALAAVVLAGLTLHFRDGPLLRIEHRHEWEEQAGAAPGGHGATEACGADAACMAQRIREDENWTAAAAGWLSDSDAAVREAAVGALSAVGGEEALSLLARAGAAETDPLLRLDQARILWEAGDRRGLEIAVMLLHETTPPLVRQEAHQLLREASGMDLGHDAEAAARWRSWLAQAE